MWVDRTYEWQNPGPQQKFMYKNDPKTSGYVTAHFIAADSATFTKTLQYPPPVVYRIALVDNLKCGKNPEFQTQQFREYRLESYKFSKFGKQQVAIYREVISS